MNYNLSKYPDDVSRLFKPRPPLSYKRPTDYPYAKRQTNPNITGVANLLSTSLKHYMEEFPEGSPNNHLQRYEDIKLSKIKNAQLLDRRLQNWNPNVDPHIKDTDPYRTIFIGRLPYDLDEIELQKYFVKFGEIEKIRIVKDKITQKSKGYAFIVFKDPISSKMAFKEIGVHRGIQIKGRVCIVDIERGRTVKYFKPRRLGGGLGGRGYSNRDSRLPGRFVSASTSNPAERNYTPRLPRRETSSSAYSADRYGSSTLDARYRGNRPLLSAATPTAAVTSVYKSRNSRTRESQPAPKEAPDY
ncbi:AIC_G0026580.mRNA.1.CDS.1 [Saccharomyces cerevisiae]|uniref:Snp1p n=1 Tax=Saccharomyces cerevisiae x Saccharomyces kudriavzevii (strain VIN7) TaxID=1095631 RepID=H0GHX6_SACCK|nr:Snp1p [Saccharomyces cerevisiae YJM270]EHN06639.1 Snp1p [Saccharomyces cerevisiae x Saccharomyces kudriavzevii VIN7]CAI4386732.1 CAS_1a_G0026790.mRNA.1.CDS.1 [Saccharomyces cerevisiae]CAI4388130.1 AIC_G0026580.mRNA.1.CDS.1 [Saccharomyces cerevisiae]CAI4392748.1 AFI_G0028640.mRNA.1.CDS.1 [Saccharomyces cerevisiae]